jgi:hypothetical protein
MRNDIKQFIRECPICQKMSPMNIGSQINPFTLATCEPMKRIYIDTIGPLNILSKEQIIAADLDNYILVIIDSFSRYTKLYATKTTKAEDALYCLTDWCSQFGAPSEMVTDNGTQFMNELITEFTQLTNTDKDSIQPYSSEENGIVERSNKEVVRHITSMTNEIKKKASYKIYLPLAQRILNSMIHSSINVSPSQIIFGNSVDHDSHFLYRPTKNTTEQSYKSVLTSMLDIQERFLKIARMNQSTTDSLHIAKRTRTETTFPTNSYVLVRYENGKDTKFSTNNHGPYKVISKQGAVYTVQSLITYELRDFHASLIKEFFYNDDYTSPETVARIDSESRGITRIFNHVWKTKKTTKAMDLSFEIEWDDSKISELTPWNSSLAKNEEIHKYLRKNSMVRFIPTMYKWPRDHPEYEKPISIKPTNPSKQMKRK